MASVGASLSLLAGEAAGLAGESEPLMPAMAFCAISNSSLNFSASAAAHAGDARRGWGGARGGGRGVLEAGVGRGLEGAGCGMAQRTLTGREADGEHGELGLLLREVSALPHPGAVGAGVLLEPDAGQQSEVGADLHRLLPPHQAPHLPPKPAATG